jgi:uncharacterized protein YbjT (DUF2867 family)
MRVALTGATGFSGSHPVAELREHWREVKAIGLAASPRADQLFSSSAEEQLP